MEKISNGITIAVIDREDQYVHSYVVHDTPFGEFLPNNIITLGKIEEGFSPLFVKKLWMTDEEAKVPSSDELATPIHKFGATYLPGIMSSTSSKNGDVLYVRNDIAAIVERHAPMQYAEDVQKTARALIPSAGFGAVRGQLRLKTVENGTDWAFGRVEDGIMYIRSSVAKALLVDEDRIIKLGRTRFNVQLWQHLDDTVGMRKEFATLFVKWVRELAESKGVMEAAFTSIDEGAEAWKTQLVAANPLMAKHPLLVAGLSSMWQGVFIEKAANPAIDARSMVAVPCAGRKPILPDGVWMIARNPGQSSVVSTAHQCKGVERGMFDKYEGAITMTITDRNGITLKGLAVIVPDEYMPDSFDVVSSVDNPKLGLNGSKEPKEIVLADAVISAILWYRPEDLIGVPYKVWGLRAGDYDGDLVVVANISDMPSFAKSLIRAKLRKEKNYKTPKSKSPLGLRINVIHNAMSNALGFSVVLRGVTWCIPEQDRDEIVSVAAQVWTGISSWEDLQGKLTAIIQTMVDSFKSLGCNTTKAREELLQFNGGLNRKVGGTPGWLRWKRVKDAFKTFYPEYPRREEVDGIPAKVWKKTPAFKAGVAESHTNCPVGRLFVAQNETLRYIWGVLTSGKAEIPDLIDFEIYAGQELRAELEDAIVRFSEAFGRDNGGAFSETLPMPTFASWAPLVSKAEIDLAGLLLPKWSAFRGRYEALRQAGAYDPSDVEQVSVRSREWRQIVDAFAREHGLESGRLAAAMWRLVHGTERAGSGESGMVFMAYPQECLAFAKAATMVKSIKCKMVGVHYNMPDMPEKIDEIVDIRMVGDNVSPFVGSLRVGSLKVDKGYENHELPVVGQFYKMVAVRLDGNGRYMATFEPV